MVSLDILQLLVSGHCGFVVMLDAVLCNLNPTLKLARSLLTICQLIGFFFVFLFSNKSPIVMAIQRHVQV